jgi:hypothetical protein
MEYNYKPTVNEWQSIEEVESTKWRSFQGKRIYEGIKAIENNIVKSVLSYSRDFKTNSSHIRLDLQ